MRADGVGLLNETERCTKQSRQCFAQLNPLLVDCLLAQVTLKPNVEFGSRASGFDWKAPRLMAPEAICQRNMQLGDIVMKKKF